jgi:hypothetical protein
MTNDITKIASNAQQKSEKMKCFQINEDRDSNFDEMVKEAEKKLQTPEDKVVEELNQKHAVVHTDQFYILTEKPHSIFKGTDFTLESKQSFTNIYENQRVICSDGHSRNKARIWLAHHGRRQLNGITFDPTTLEDKNGRYNIWKGFAVNPLKGKCNLYKKHIQDVICAENQNYFQYVWKWMAHLVQYPDKVTTGLVLIGLQGTGKGVFVKALGKIFGQHYVHLDNLDRLLGNFNFHMKDAVLVYADEAIWGGNKRDVGKLKAMVTEEYAMIEPKGKDSFMVKNFRHFIFSSNDNWPLHLDPDDRRFLVLEVSDNHKEDESYFSEIINELDEGGYEALLFELLNENLVGFNPRKLPINTESFQVKLQSTSSSIQYLYDALREGCFDVGNLTPCECWPEQPLSFCRIYNDYSAWCNIQRRLPEQKSVLGKALNKLLPSIVKSRPAAGYGPRPECYTFRSLTTTREDFQKSFKVGIDIWEK